MKKIPSICDMLSIRDQYCAHVRFTLTFRNLSLLPNAAMGTKINTVLMVEFGNELVYK